MKLKDHVAIVTGAASGIGKAIAETLLHQFLPQLSAAEAGDPENILISAVDRVLADYQSACGTPS